MVVWPVQEPVVEMVLSLSGARLKMTVLGLLKAPHTYGLASLATLPSDLGSMHETPIDAVSMVLSPRASPIGRRGMYVRYSRLAASTLAAPPSIRHAEGPSALHALITAGLAMAHGLDARSDARHPHHTSRRRPAKSAKQTPPLKSWLFSLCLPTFHAQGPARRSLPAWISILVARDPSVVQFVASAAIVADPSRCRWPTRRCC